MTASEEEATGQEVAANSAVTPWDSVPRRRGPWRIESWPLGVAHAVTAVLLAAIAVIDRSTPPGLAFILLYFLPLSIAAWRFPRWGALLWAVLATGAWAAAGQPELSGSAGFALFWNGAVHMALFLAASLAVARIRLNLEERRRLAGTDMLTGVQNGRAFQELVELERSRALRYNRPFTLAYMDVDGFRAVNELNGRSAGDATLRLIATTIRENIRSMDSVARLGGDEFGFLFPETGPGSADVAIRKIRGCLDDALSELRPSLTFSIGAVVCTGAPESVDALIQRADALMYEVKQSGKNDLKTVVLEDNFGIEAILQRG